MMSDFGSAKALSSFLGMANAGAPADARDAIDRLGVALLAAGETGLSFADAMVSANLDRSTFFSALSTASKLGLIENFDSSGENRLRLTETGRSLY